MDPEEDWGLSFMRQENEVAEKLRLLKVKDSKPAVTYPAPAVTHPTPTVTHPAPAVTHPAPAVTHPTPTVTQKPSSPPPPSEIDDKPTALSEISLWNKILRNQLLENKHDVKILQNDPNSPLYSVKTFEELRLRPELLKGVYDMGFNRPSKIQEKALPILLADPPMNFIAQSQSGTGKTAAFVLTMLSRIDPALKCPQIICLSPTFDLARQNGDVLLRMGRFCPDIKMIYAVRGERVEPGVARTEHIIMGTAGTVLDWIFKRKVMNPDNIKMLVLDEADVMIDLQGQQDQTIRIQKKLPSSCQKVLFSATYSDEVREFAQRVVPNPIMITLKRNEETLDNIKQFYVECTNEEDKFEAITNLYAIATIAQAMIFCQTRKSAEWLAGEMCKQGHAVALITGDSTPDQRIAVLNRFRDGKEKVLITTNLCSRGIDVEQVSVVINYDIPMDAKRQPDCETYLHRIGRTGRFGRKGLAINFIDGSLSKKSLEVIKQHFGRDIIKLDTNDFDVLEKAIST